MLYLTLILASADAASLDNLEIAGSWGSPTADNPSAAWWNPAGLALAGRHQILLEGAPTIATFSYDRPEPRAGTDVLQTRALVPFAGFSTDLGIDNLGIGASLSIPVARGSASTVDDGAARYHLQSGDIIAATTSLAISYDIADVVSVGFSAHRVASSWAAELDNDIMVDLYDELGRQDLEPDPAFYNDDNLENPDYAASLTIGPLTDVAWTWSGGLLIHPGDALSIGLAYTAGYDLDHSGTAEVELGCPPQEDIYGRFGAESRGLCDSTLPANAAIAYRIPYRVHAGVAFRPKPSLRLEGFGGLVGWSQFADFGVVVSDVAEQNPSLDPEAAALIEQERLWARDNHNSVFAGLDAKLDIQDRWLAGGRLLVDRSAVPDHAAGPNNYDADTLAATAMLGYRLRDILTVSLSYGHHFVQTRTIEDSRFSMAIDPDSRAEDRWFYPNSNGTYQLQLDRIGLAVSAGF